MNCNQLLLNNCLIKKVQFLMYLLPKCQVVDTFYEKTIILFTSGWIPHNGKWGDRQQNFSSGSWKCDTWWSTHNAIQPLRNHLEEGYFIYSSFQTKLGKPNIFKISSPFHYGVSKSTQKCSACFWHEEQSYLLWSPVPEECSVLSMAVFGKASCWLPEHPN